jgi:hypothetical protein
MAIVKRSDDMEGFVALPRGWVVERIFCWFGRSRRLAKGFREPRRDLATFVTVASNQPALRRLVSVEDARPRTFTGISWFGDP